MQRRILIVALLLIAAPIVAAHGGRTTEQKCSSSYCVQWATYNFVVEDEFVRFGYNATDKSSGEQVDQSDDTLDFVFKNAAGETIETKQVTLSGPQNGFYIGDIQIPTGDITSFENPVPLPNGESVTFTLEVQSSGSDGNGGNGGNGNTTPLPGWVAVPALAGAALVLASRRKP